MRPAVGASSPASMRIVVDLPEPFGPRKPKMPPRGMSKLTLSTAVKSPNRRVTSRTETMLALAAGCSAAHAARPAASLRSTNTSSSDGAIGSTSTELGPEPGLSPRPSQRPRTRRARLPPAPRCRRSCRGRAGRCRTATRRRRRRRVRSTCFGADAVRGRDGHQRADRSATAARRACRRRPGVRRRGSRCARRTPLRPCTASTRRWSGRGGSARAASSRTRGATADRRRWSARRAAADRARSRSAAASASFCFMPPESAPARRARNGLEADHVEQARGAALRLVARHAVEIAAQPHVLVDREILIEPEALRHEAEGAGGARAPCRRSARGRRRRGGRTWSCRRRPGRSARTSRRAAPPA